MKMLHSRYWSNRVVDSLGILAHLLVRDKVTSEHL